MLKRCPGKVQNKVKDIKEGVDASFIIWIVYPWHLINIKETK